MIYGLEFRGQGSGFRYQGSVFKVLRFRAKMTEIRVFRSKTRCRIRERAKTKPYRRNYEQVLFLYRGTEAIRQGP